MIVRATPDGLSLVALRDTDDDLSIGVPVLLPDLTPLQLEKDAVESLTRALVRNKLTCWADVQAGQNIITAVVKRLAREHNFNETEVRRFLIMAYKLRR